MRKASGYERRTVPFEARVDGEGTETRIKGHAAIFNSLSENLGMPGWFDLYERIEEGSLAPALERVKSGEDDVYALLNHDENIIVGGTRVKTGTGSLELSVDKKGLYTETVPLDTATVRDLVLEPMRRGLLRKMSFGFLVDDEHEEKKDGKFVRVITGISRLFDISFVTFPAYPATDVQARSLLETLKVDPAQLSSREQVALRSFIETISRHLQPAAAAQGGQARDASAVPAGAGVDLLRRRLDLHMREFNAGETLH